MNVFTQVQKRRQELIAKGFQPSSLVLIVNGITMLTILRDAMQDEEQAKNFRQIRTFYGMDVIIIKGDNFDHNRQIYFEIFEQLNTEK